MTTLANPAPTNAPGQKSWLAQAPGDNFQTPPGSPRRRDQGSKTTGQSPVQQKLAVNDTSWRLSPNSRRDLATARATDGDDATVVAAAGKLLTLSQSVTEAEQARQEFEERNQAEKSISLTQELRAREAIQTGAAPGRLGLQTVTGTCLSGRLYELQVDSLVHDAQAVAGRANLRRALWSCSRDLTGTPAGVRRLLLKAPLYTSQQLSSMGICVTQERPPHSLVELPNMLRFSLLPNPRHLYSAVDRALVAEFRACYTAWRKTKSVLPSNKLEHVLELVAKQEHVVLGNGWDALWHATGLIASGAQRVLWVSEAPIGLDQRPVLVTTDHRRRLYQLGRTEPSPKQGSWQPHFKLVGALFRAACATQRLDAQRLHPKLAALAADLAINNGHRGLRLHCTLEAAPMAVSMVPEYSSCLVSVTWQTQEGDLTNHIQRKEHSYQMLSQAATCGTSSIEFQVSSGIAQRLREALPGLNDHTPMTSLRLAPGSAASGLPAGQTTLISALCDQLQLNYVPTGVALNVTLRVLPKGDAQRLASRLRSPVMIIPRENTSFASPTPVPRR